ncbi:MAG: 5-methyltetrahydrofolate--homocysteine methyltransferase [Butyrivibrio sp.]|jgi:5-methyltetrahydrofolate--homocysteine methyltransferase|uniref:homocysteine S-methyltransferase family protein n=1 Tax=Butyrivibrio sp. TaxID=28121 RepID=UPI001EB9AB88|nr:homocysteine S-methyltransferase family protein [Butyrivibrio sp.]MBE5841759.1 5-methyltetrahydrofolate--homocysteine methyltransferase [Butyrivibrio sp.]
MNKEAFLKFCENKMIFLDGATGTNLMKAGMPAGVCPEKWILEHKDVMLELQKAYVDAGSDIIYAPTFTGNRIKLSDYGLNDQIKEINTELVKLAKEAAGDKALVAGDITMTGRQLKPIGDLDFEELVDVYKEQIKILEEAGCDILVVETMMSLQECRAALIAASEVTDMAVMVTLTFEADGRTLYGSDAASSAITLEAMGASAIGANCSTGPDKMEEVIRNMAEVTRIPIIAKPNAGLPSVDANGNTEYDMDAGVFTTEIERLINAGASILGGCCGSTPEYIALLKKTYGDRKIDKDIPRKISGRRYLSSERRSLSFGMDDLFMIVGERINPTGKKKLQAELREGNLDMVSDFARSQEEDGASVLDINVGMSGIDEKEMMLKVMEEVISITDLPLCIDTSSAEVMEAALRLYPGRALMNSISLEKGKAEKFLPLAKKYGAMFILLPLNPEGLPKNTEEKISNINTLSQMAYDMGMTQEDIVVDGLVATVGADPNAAINTLDTIGYCHDNGFATICGLSNISFGLPQRMNVNTAFLTMAISRGLSMAIANPSQEMLVNAAFASDLLRNKDGADIRYIQRMQRYEGEKDALLGGTKEVTASLVNSDNILDIIKQDVLNGSKRTIVKDTERAINEGIEPRVILDNVLMPAINEVGDLFDKGKYFLPQLISGAEAMKLSIGYLEPLLQKGADSGNKLPSIVIATVHGDIHDIGKNLVALMLKNYGFNVIDLGKDVPKEEIIKAAKENNASIIALSALMTTTMKEMKNVVDLAKKEDVSSKIIIGGAVVTQDYADEIGADGYSSDAADAVRVVKQILNIE